MTHELKSQNIEREIAILEVASKLFLRYGYDKTTISDIAKAAHISKGAVYLHFESKETLFEALIQHEIARYHQAWIQQIHTEMSLSDLYRQRLMVLMNHPLIIALIRHEIRIPDAASDRIRYPLHGEQQLFTRFMDAMHQAGIQLPVLPDILALLTFALAHHDKLLPDADRPAPESLIDGIAALLESALTVPESQRAIAHHAIAEQIKLFQESPQDSAQG